MAWIPSYKIIAGLLAGKKTPAGGSLQGLYDFPSVSRGSSGDVRFAQRLDFANDSWEGAYGTLCLTDLINHAKASVESGNLGEWYLLAEIEVDNPEGAQYYKQTYVIEARDETSCRYRENSYTYQDYEYTCRWFEAQWSFSVSRYQYDTPYSGYTRTDLSANSNRGSGFGCEIVEENISDAAYYAFTGGWVWDRLLISLGSFISSDEKDCFGVAMYGTRYYLPTRTVPEPDPSDRKSFAVIGQTVEWLNTLYGGEFLPEETEDPNEDDDEDGDNNDEEGGGDGDHDKHQDNILIPDLPSLSASGAGFITMYRMTQSNMLSFARKLFDPDVWDTVKAFFADPLDFICGIMIVPYSPTTGGMAMPIFPRQAPLPDIEWGEYYQVIENQYKVIDCGSYTIPLFYNSAFDYSPYTKISVWLPYIGYRDLNADEVMGSTIHIEYHCDCLTGDCIAFISRLAISGGSVPVNQVIAQFNGNCGVRVPFGRMSFDSAITGSMQLIAGAAGALGGIASMIAGSGGMPSGGKQLAEGMVASQVGGMAMGAVNAMKARVERAGAAGASAGYMAIQKPYIIRQIPHQSLPSNYRRLNGYPANIGGTLGSFSGYTCVESIELTGISATAEEKREILALLTGGVIV